MFINWGIMIKWNKNEHNDEILREIQNRIMMEIWSIIPTSLAILKERDDTTASSMVIIMRKKINYVNIDVHNNNS